MIFQSKWGSPLFTDMRMAQLDTQNGKLLRVKGVVSGGYVGRTRLIASSLNVPSRAAITSDGNYMFIPH